LVVGLGHTLAGHHRLELAEAFHFHLGDQGPVSRTAHVGHDPHLAAALLHQLSHGEELLDQRAHLAGLAVHHFADDDHLRLSLVVGVEPCRVKASSEGRLMTVGPAQRRLQVLERTEPPADPSPMHSRRASGAIGIVAALLLPWLAGPAGSQGVVRPTGPVVPPARAPPDAPYAPAEPTARYGSYRAAGDSLRLIVRHALGSWADRATWKRTREPFDFVLSSEA